jgi:HAMP domain-containing protein
MKTFRPWMAILGALLLGVVVWAAWSRSAGERSALATAEQQLARHDYQAALRTLDEAAATVKADERFQVLRAQAYANTRQAAGEGNEAASPAAAATDALHGFRILIYPLTGSRADQARAQDLERKLVKLVPADVEIRPHTREELNEIGPPRSDELRYDTSLMLDQRAARALHAILQKAELGDFALRDGRDRGAGTLYILFAATASQSARD